MVFCSGLIGGMAHSLVDYVKYKRLPVSLNSDPSLLLHLCQKCRFLARTQTESCKMSFENSDNAQTFGSKLSQNWNRNAFQNADISPNWASVRISAPLPNPIKRPTIKVESETKNLDQPCLTTQPPAGDVWSYVPDYVLNSWRSSQGIPGVRDQAPEMSHIAHIQKELFSSGYFSNISSPPMAGSEHYECLHWDHRCLQIRQRKIGHILDGMGGVSHHGLLPASLSSPACLETNRGIPCAHQLAPVRLRWPWCRTGRGFSAR